MAKGIQNCWLYSVSSVLVSFILCSALVTTSSIHGILQEAKFGPFNFTELEQALYDVELLRVPLPESALLSQGREKADYTTLVSRHGQRYACELPWQSSPSDEHTIEEQKQPDMNITALLLPLQNRPCPIKTVGWWTYEYCHGQFVRQYHMEGGKVVGKTIYIGFYENETEWNKEQVDRVQSIVNSLKDTVGAGPLPVTYHQVHFVNGTVCEANKKPRTAKVLIRCSLSSDDKLYEVVERETCSYTLIIHTAMLCHHPLFVTGNRGRSHTLSCHPLLSQSDYQKYQERLGHSKRSADSPNTIEHKLPTNGDFQSFLSEFTTSQNKDHIHVPTSHTTMEQSTTPGEATTNTDNTEQNPPSLNKGEKVGEDIDSKVHTRPSSSNMKDLTVEKLTQEIEYAYKQLVASLDEQKDTDPTAARLKKSITSHYSDFDKLRKRKAMEEEVEKHLTEDVKNFKESKGVLSSKKERPAVKPYEVQGVREAQRSVDAPLERVGEKELVEEDALTFERLTDMEEAINKEIEEHLRENGIEGKADVKVVALPMNVMEMLLDEDSELETDGENDDTVKMILKFGEGQLFGNSELSKLFTLNSPPTDERRMSTDERRVRDLESSYDQVWGEQEEADKKRRT